VRAAARWKVRHASDEAFEHAAEAVEAERWLVARYLESFPGRETPAMPPGDAVEGRYLFIRTGCVACHLLADAESASVAEPEPRSWRVRNAERNSRMRPS
jgi:mono/diheme cytochrome c family protein